MTVFRLTRKTKVIVLVASGLSALLVPTPVHSLVAPNAHRARSEGVRSYWTPQRMSEAIPIDPAKSHDRARTKRGPIPYLSEPVPDPTALSYPAVGTLFGKIGRFQFTCSATIVNAASARLVWTAAHCLRDRGRFGDWVRKIVFVPGYQTGARPYGTWLAGEYWVSNPWVTRKASEKTDFGALIIRRSNGVGLQTAVGHAYNIGFNQPLAQGWEAIGYPADPAFGDQMWHCISGLYGVDNGQPRKPGPPPFGIGCNMTPGSSGGPFVSQAGAVGGVTSFGFNEEPELLYATYLGSKAAALYGKVQGR